MWEAIHPTFGTDSTLASTYWREASHVRAMRKGEHQQSFPDRAKLIFSNIALQRLLITCSTSPYPLWKATLQVPLRQLPKDFHSPHDLDPPPESPHWNDRGSCCGNRGQPAPEQGTPRPWRRNVPRSGLNSLDTIPSSAPVYVTRR